MKMPNPSRICLAAGLLLTLGMKVYNLRGADWALHAYAASTPLAYTVSVRDISRASGYRNEMTITHARRADGSTVLITRNREAVSPTGEVEIRELHFANGLYIDTRDDIKTKTTRQHSPDDPRVKAYLLSRIDPATQCTKNLSGKAWSQLPLKFEGMEPVNGYQTMKVVLDVGYALTQWLAPDFGCEIIKGHLDFKDGGYSDQEPTQLELGEPDPSLFAVANDMKEASPIEVATGLAKLSHQEGISLKDLPAIQKQEAIYQQLKLK